MIRLGKYKLIPCEHSIMWDLKVEHTRENKEGKKEKVFVDLGYGMPLEYTLRKVIQEEIRNKGDIDTPTKFLKEFLKLSDKFVKQLRELQVEG